VRTSATLFAACLITACPTPVPEGSDAGPLIDAGGGNCEAWDDTLPAAAEMMGVFDPERRQLVFFGGDDHLPVNCTNAGHAVGLDKLYVYDAACSRFKEVEVSGDVPAARARGMAVYDSDSDQMVLFGGRARDRAQGTYTNFNDTWLLDLGTLEWRQLNTGRNGPSARSNPAGGYNPSTGEMIVFGGNESVSGLSFAPRNDTWALDVETAEWRRLITTGDRPSARLFHAAAVDPVSNRLFVFGGGDANAWEGPFLGDLYQLDMDTLEWTPLNGGGAGAPAGRIWSTITYDAANDRVLLFGGHDDGAVGNNNDTWSFDLQSGVWEALVDPETVNRPANAFCDFPPDFTEPNLDAPDRRSAHLAALDARRGEWIVFGGKTDCGIIDDVWVFDLTRDAWIRLHASTVGEACVRGDRAEACVAMCR
jgi:hypothetical protein